MRVRNMILPSAYQRVEYIESTGTQYIDTGVLSSSDSWTFQTKLQAKALELTQGLFGATNGFNVSVMNGTYRATGNVITSIAPSSTYDEIEMSNNVSQNSITLTINGVSQSGTYTSWTTGNAIGVFGYGASSSVISTLSQCKIYYLRIIVGGSLVRNFIPCYRKSDNVIGLYDLVNGVFYTNAGSGTFLKGGDVTDTYNVPYIPILNSIPTLSDTLSTTSSNYVFTKKLGVADIGSFSGCVLLSANQFYFDLGNAKHPDSSTTLANIFCEKYERDTYVNVYNKTKNKTIALNTNGWALVYDTSYSTVNDFLNAMSGVLLTYELATSQTITIPKRHCGLVDLGTLTWTYQTISGHKRFYATLTGAINTNVNNVNLYSTLYIAKAETSDKNMWLYGGVIYIVNDSYTDATTFTNAMKGVYLYYETEDEISDLPTKLKPRLQPIPSDYQQVEYIESSGTQYIDSGIAPSSISPIVKIKFYYKTRVGESNALFGCWGANDTRFQIWWNGIGIGTVMSYSFTNNTMYEIELNGVVPRAVINGTTYTSGITKDNGFSTSNMYLFSRNESGSANAGMPQQLYYCKIYNNDVLVRNFVPCYRKSDNEIGLYDTITQTFFTNAGTGTFTKGNNKNTII